MAAELEEVGELLAGGVVDARADVALEHAAAVAAHEARVVRAPRRAAGCGIRGGSPCCRSHRRGAALHLARSPPYTPRIDITFHIHYTHYNIVPPA